MQSIAISVILILVYTCIFVAYRLNAFRDVLSDFNTNEVC